MRSLLGTVIEDEADVTVVDMEAGLEHLSRSGGTLAFTDALLVVMEPSRKSVVTAARTIQLAEELGIPRTYGVGNKAQLPADAKFFEELCHRYDVPLAGAIPHDLDVVDADRAGSRLEAGHARAVRAEIERLVDYIDRMTVT